MKWPPYLLRLRFENKGHDFSLWLPLFLIWPLVLAFLLAVFLILLPFALLALIFTWRWGWLNSLVMSGPALLRLFGQLAGLEVDVSRKDGGFYIAFI
jgi:hypothetical protein